jgi:hypothetical protein
LDVVTSVATVAAAGAGEVADVAAGAGAEGLAADAVGAVAEGGGSVVALFEAAELAPQPPSAKVRVKSVSLENAVNACERYPIATCSHFGD